MISKGFDSMGSSKEDVNTTRNGTGGRGTRNKLEEEQSGGDSKVEQEVGNKLKWAKVEA